MPQQREEQELKLAEGNTPVTSDGIAERQLTVFEVGERTFHSFEAAQEFRTLTRAAEAISSVLPSAVDPDGEFKKGKGYIQHSEKAVQLFRKLFEAALALHYGEDYASNYRIDPYEDVAVMRVLSDSSSPLFDTWQRGRHIDLDNREWGSTSFVRTPATPNPDEGLMEEWTEVE